MKKSPQGASPLIPKNVHSEHNVPLPYHLFEINKRMMGGGMSQNYASLYFFEYYIENYGFDYVLEIGTQKGALSLYLSNMANVTERFIFHTVDISTKDYYARETEGVGHWLDKINMVGEYSEFFEGDVFKLEIFQKLIIQNKSLIFCDGGNKAEEFKFFAPMMKPGDHIVLHDWGMEVTENQIKPTMEKHNIFFNEPYVKSCNLNDTLLMPFIKI